MPVSNVHACVRTAQVAHKVCSRDTQADGSGVKLRLFARAAACRAHTRRAAVGMAAAVFVYSSMMMSGVSLAALVGSGIAVGVGERGLA